MRSVIHWLRRGGGGFNEVKKRRQHHVWQHYLKPWTTDGQLHCLSAGHTFQANTLNVAVGRDFYRLPPLSELDIALIRMLVINPTDPHRRRVHEDFLSGLLAPRRFVEANRIGNLPEVDKVLDVQANNVLEDYHQSIEQSFASLLERAVQGDVGFYDDSEDCITFLHYLCSQHMRTVGIRDKTVSRLKDKVGLDVSRVWPVVSHMIAVNVGGSLYAERASRKLLVLRNETATPFVTGDQPVLNLLAEPSGPPRELALYYPVAPGLALVLSETDGRSPVPAGSLDSAQVANLNVKMLNASHSQVFGCSAASLAHVLALASPADVPD